MRSKIYKIRFSEVEWTELQTLSVGTKLSKYIRSRLFVGTKWDEKKEIVGTIKKKDPPYEIVREGCDTCGGRDFKKNRHTKKEECTVCCKKW